MEAKWIALVVRVLFNLKLAKTPFQMMYRITSHLISTQVRHTECAFFGGVGGGGGGGGWGVGG